MFVRFLISTTVNVTVFDYCGPRDHSAWAWPAVGTGRWALAVHRWQFTVYRLRHSLTNQPVVQLLGRLPDQFPKVWRSFVNRQRRPLKYVPRDCTCMTGRSTVGHPQRQLGFLYSIWKKVCTAVNEVGLTFQITKSLHIAQFYSSSRFTIANHNSRDSIVPCFRDIICLFIKVTSAMLAFKGFKELMEMKVTRGCGCDVGCKFSFVFPNHNTILPRCWMQHRPMGYLSFKCHINLSCNKTFIKQLHGFDKCE